MKVWTFHLFGLKMSIHAVKHTHTQLFYCSSGICPGPPVWAGTREVKAGRLKPIWIYWSKRWWLAMAFAGLYASLHLIPDNHANMSPLSFFTGRMPFLPPNQQRHSTEGISTEGIYSCPQNLGYWDFDPLFGSNINELSIGTSLHEFTLFEPTRLSCRWVVQKGGQVLQLLVLQLFYGSLDFVRDNPDEPVPEETFTHSHSSWSSIIPICFLHLVRFMASSLFSLRAWLSSCTISVQVFLVYLLACHPPLHIPYIFTQSLFPFRSTCPYDCNLFCCSAKIMSCNASLSTLYLELCLVA